MYRSLDLNKSTLLGLRSTPTRMIVEIDPACIVESPAAGSRSLSFAERRIELQITGAGPWLVLETLPARIARASLSIAGRLHHNDVPLPLIYTGPTELRVTTSAFETLSVRGSGVAIVFVP